MPARGDGGCFPRISPLRPDAQQFHGSGGHEDDVGRRCFTLVLIRREGESLTISLGSNIDPMTAVCELFAGGPLVITVGRIRGGMGRLGVMAEPRLTVLRSEVAPHGTAENWRVRDA